MSQPTYGNGVFAPVAGQPDPRGPASSSFTRQDFAQAILQQGGWPVNQSNIQFLLNWMQREGGNAAFNPINTTHSADGATNYNSVGVKNYTSFDQGVSAIVATLHGSYYHNIVGALAAGQASEWDKAGRLASDLHAWSAGPNAPMSKGYTTVSNVNGSGDAAVSGSAADAAAAASGGGGLSLNDVMLTYAPELAKAMGDPEIKNLLNRLDAGLNGGPDGISVDQFEVQLEQTNWWKTTPQSQRLLLSTQATDPATAQQNLQNQMASVDSLAWSKGIKLTPDLEYKIALDSIKNQWSNQQILQQVVASNQTQYSAGGKFGGEAATDVEQIKSLYASYALPVNDQQLNADVQNVLAGKSTVGDLEQQIGEQAATFYSANPQLAQFLQGGKGTVTQWASPLITQAANLLGINPSTVDLTSPQWSFLLKPQTNPATGQSLGQAQTLDSVQQTIQNDPIYGYSKTANGIAQYQAFGQKLVAAFGGGTVNGA